MPMISGNRTADRKGRRIQLLVVSLAFLGSACQWQHRPLSADAMLYNQAETALAAQDYAAALQVYQELLEQFPGSEYGDDAQFKIGFLFICHKNPQVHYDKALAAFQELIKDYPQSIWVYEATNWVKILESRLEFKAKVEQIIKVPPPEMDTERLKQVQNRLQELDAALDKLAQEKKSLAEENEKLKSVLKKLEALDR